MILVLSPTRELAQQIANEAEALSTYHLFQTVVLVGVSVCYMYIHIIYEYTYVCIRINICICIGREGSR